MQTGLHRFDRDHAQAVIEQVAQHIAEENDARGQAKTVG
jgi:hypothetical protein